MVSKEIFITSDHIDFIHKLASYLRNERPCSFVFFMCKIFIARGGIAKWDFDMLITSPEENLLCWFYALGFQTFKEQQEKSQLTTEPSKRRSGEILCESRRKMRSAWNLNGWYRYCIIKTYLALLNTALSRDSDVKSNYSPRMQNCNLCTIKTL